MGEKSQRKLKACSWETHGQLRKLRQRSKQTPEYTNGAGGVTAAEMQGLKIKEPHPSPDTSVGGMRGVLAASQCAPGVIQLPKMQSLCPSLVWL